MNTEEERLQSLAREWWFLLKHKSKYAGMFEHWLNECGLLKYNCALILAGQSIAIRLSKRINVVTKQLKSKLDVYNSKHPPTRRVTWEGITQLDADQPSAIPCSTKYRAVRLFHKVARANEEEFRIMSKMRNTIQHYLCKFKVITASIPKKWSDYISKWSTFPASHKEETI